MFCNSWRVVRWQLRWMWDTRKKKKNMPTLMSTHVYGVCSLSPDNSSIQWTWWYTRFSISNFEIISENLSRLVTHVWVSDNRRHWHRHFIVCVFRVFGAKPIPELMKRCVDFTHRDNFQGNLESSSTKCIWNLRLQDLVIKFMLQCVCIQSH